MDILEELRVNCIWEKTENLCILTQNGLEYVSSLSIDVLIKIWLKGIILQVMD